MIPETFGARVDIAACEARLMTCWPAHRTEPVGDWLCRFAGGYSGRANSACSFIDGADLAPDAIRAIEARYREAGLRPSFRLSPLIAEPLRLRLEAMGYRPEDPSVGMIGPAFQATPDAGLALESAPSQAWLDGACRWQEASKRDPAKLMGIVGNLAVSSRFASVLVEGQGAAYGLISLDRGMAEFGAVIVDPARRGQGLARRLVSGMIGWAREAGAERIFLQAAIDNAVARRLYASMGFSDLYTAAYWRRPAAP